MSTGPIHRPVRRFSWAKAIGLGVVIVGALILCYGVIARLVEGSNPRDPTTGEPEYGAITDRSVPPLKPFSRTSSRFAKEITFTGLLDCPTPGVFGEPQYFASEGFLKRSGLLNDLSNQFRKRPFYYRRVQQPEQTIRFTSHMTIAEIHPQLEGHFKNLGFLLNLSSVRFTAKGVPADDSGKPIDTWRSARWQVFCSVPYPRFPKTAKAFAPDDVSIRLVQYIENDPDAPLHSSVPYTEVEIRTEEYKYDAFPE